MNTTPDAQTLSFAQLHSRMETLERVAVMWTEEQLAKERAADAAAARAARRREIFWQVFTQVGPIIVIVAGVVAVLFHLFAALDLVDELRRARTPPAPVMLNIEPPTPPSFYVSPDAPTLDWHNDGTWLEGDEHPFGESPSRL